MKESGGLNESGEITRRSFLAKGAMFTFAAAVTGPGLTVLSGCGGGGSSSSEPLTFMQFYAPGGDVKVQSKWFEDLVAAWNDENETKVKLQYVPSSEYVSGNKLQTAFSSGEGPDIFLVSATRFLTYYNPGVLQDLKPAMKQEAIDDFYPDVVNSRVVDDGIYGLPMEVEPLAMYYSKKAFEDAGLSEGDLPESWEDLLDVGQKLKTKDRFGALFPVVNAPYQNFNWYPFMWQGGGEPVSKDNESSTFVSDATTEALSLWQEAVKSGVSPRTVLGSGGGDVVSNLVSGFCAMQQLGIWGLSDLRENAPDFDYGVFRLPLPPDGKYATNLGGWAFTANAKGKNPEEAARFCAWALGSTSESGVKRVADWCFEAKSDLSPRKSVQKEGESRGAFDSGNMKLFRDDFFPGGRAEPRYPPEIFEPITQAIQACMLDGADPKAQARRASESIDSFLQGYSGADIVA